MVHTNRCVVEMLDAYICPLTITQLHRIIREAVTSGEQTVITSQNLHGIYLFHRNEKMRALHKISYPRIDGMSIIVLGRLLGYDVTREQRVTWVDWIGPFLHEAVREEWRIFYLGSSDETVAKGSEMLRAQYPGLKITVRGGYFDMSPDSHDNNAVLQDIDQYGPDILLVGMGMPRQEAWIYDNLRRLNVSCILTCGALMEYIAGAVPTPPRWMGRLGLEWLYRLLSEPRRLAHRYLIEPWFLTGLIIRSFVRRSGRK